MKPCPFTDCQKTLSTAYKLKLHIQRCHYNLRLFQCAHCLKHFKSNDSLKRHQFCHRTLASEKKLEAVSSGETVVGEVVVPKLTVMLMESDDLDLRPMLHIDRVYPYSYHLTKVVLPPIQKNDQNAV